jgi:hypothetical protein
MKAFSSARSLLMFCAVAETLAGCTVPGSAPSPATATSGSSWIETDSAGASLLYVSDWATNDVFIYNYSSRSAAGKLTGFKQPSGQCVDGTRDVWIAELQGFDVVAYAHGGKTPIARLSTDGYPIGCAIDAASGDLAVANLYTKHGRGSIQVWKHASGTPATYKPSRLYYLWPPAYDDEGNLFVEGELQDGSYGVSELPRGGNALRTVTLKGAAIHFAGAALWDGTHVGLTDQASGSDNTTVIYRVRFTGTTGAVVGRTHLMGRCRHGESDVAAPFVVHGGTADEVLGGNLSCSNDFDYWTYPAGGSPHASLRGAPAEPFGGSVSPARENSPQARFHTSRFELPQISGGKVRIVNVSPSMVN